MKKVLLRRPSQFIKVLQPAADAGLIYLDDVIKLYDEVFPRVLDRMGLDYVIIDNNESLRRVYIRKDSIFIGWHNHGTTPHTWFIHPGYVTDYFYFDRTGYSGWSELTEHYEYDVDVEDVRDEVQEFITHYITNNISRVTPQQNKTLPDEPYVLVLEQRPDDAVADLAYVDLLTDKVKKAFEGTKYGVCVKPHPLNMEYNYQNQEYNWTINEEMGLHELIANATAVYTINSGTGFEALLHGKKVFTAGQCDYHWMTDVLKTDEDVIRSVERVEEPVDQDEITKFIHYCLNKYWMNIHDDSTVERKILTAINE